MSDLMCHREPLPGGGVVGIHPKNSHPFLASIKSPGKFLVLMRLNVDFKAKAFGNFFDLNRGRCDVVFFQKMLYAGFGL